MFSLIALVNIDDISRRSSAYGEPASSISNLSVMALIPMQNARNRTTGGMMLHFIRALLLTSIVALVPVGLTGINVAAESAPKDMITLSPESAKKTLTANIALAKGDDQIKSIVWYVSLMGMPIPDDHMVHGAGGKSITIEKPASGKYDITAVVLVKTTPTPITVTCSGELSSDFTLKLSDNKEGISGTDPASVAVNANRVGTPSIASDIINFRRTSDPWEYLLDIPQDATLLTVTETVGISQVGSPTLVGNRIELSIDARKPGNHKFTITLQRDGKSNADIQKDIVIDRGGFLTAATKTVSQQEYQPGLTSPSAQSGIDPLSTTFGISAYVEKEKTRLGIPYRDHHAFETAHALSEFFSTMSIKADSQAKDHPGSGQDTASLKKEAQAGYKKILAELPGREKDWQPLFIGVDSYLKRLVSGVNKAPDGTDVTKPDFTNFHDLAVFWQELSQAFDQTSASLKQQRDDDDQAMAKYISAGGGANNSSSTFGNGDQSGTRCRKCRRCSRLLFH